MDFELCSEPKSCATVQVASVSRDKMLCNEGIYRMEGDQRPSDRIVVFCHSAAVAAFWWMPGILQTTAFDKKLFGDRRFVRVNEKLIMEIVPK